MSQLRSLGFLIIIVGLIATLIGIGLLAWGYPDVWYQLNGISAAERQNLTQWLIFTVAPGVAFLLIGIPLLNYEDVEEI